MKIIPLPLLLIALHLGSFVFSSPSDRKEELLKSNEPLFVSLGSYCEGAHMLKFCERRKAAFPLDWIISFDGEAVIEMLQNGFDDLFNEVHFIPYGPAGHLLHNRYHLEFLHEGNFNQDYEDQFEDLKQKYTRRIDRFYSLKDYQGKVYFIRNAYIYSTTNLHRFFQCSANIEITEDYAMRLYQALKFVFSDLDFDLLVINSNEGNGFNEQKTLSEHVKFFTVNPHLELPQKIEAYRAFFDAIVNEG